MRRLVLLLALSTNVLAFGQASSNAVAPTPERHEFVLHNFKTESGVVLPEAHIVYGTMGTLNADHSNAVLLPSHY
ncbi:MAG TPA: homoserine acetyltransferase, partial [Terriglobus sp.]